MKAGSKEYAELEEVDRIDGVSVTLTGVNEGRGEVAERYRTEVGRGQMEWNQVLWLPCCGSMLRSPQPRTRLRMKVEIGTGDYSWSTAGDVEPYDRC
jgi:hypothetical protein